MRIATFADATWYRLWWSVIAVLTILALRVWIVAPILRALEAQTVALIEAQAQAAAAIIANAPCGRVNHPIDNTREARENTVSTRKAPL